jgi:hypothetical protein
MWFVLLWFCDSKQIQEETLSLVSLHLLRLVLMASFTLITILGFKQWRPNFTLFSQIVQVPSRNVYGVLNLFANFVLLHCWKSQTIVAKTVLPRALAEIYEGIIISYETLICTTDTILTVSDTRHTFNSKCRCHSHRARKCQKHSVEGNLIYFPLHFLPSDLMQCTINLSKHYNYIISTK